jgi:hypothetical protein
LFNVTAIRNLSEDETDILSGTSILVEIGLKNLGDFPAAL